MKTNNKGFRNINFFINKIKNPYSLFVLLTRYYNLKFLKDKTYISLMYKGVFGKKINLVSPKTYSEKIQYLKLYDRKPIYNTLVDKYLVRDYIIKNIGEEFLIPIFGVYDSFDDINFSILPNEFVIKCTHDSHSVLICKDKSSFDINKAKLVINKALKRNYFYEGRQWVYKDLKPKIVVEQYMEDEFNELRDYKFFCFSGKVKASYISTDRMNGEVKFNYYDKEFNKLNFKQSYDISSIDIIKPLNYDLMVELAEKLSLQFPHVRIDFYDINGKIYFGEFTFYHMSGFVKFNPEFWDEKFGSWIDLSLIIRDI